MRIHEEYVLRHRLNIPLIRFDSRSNLFLKTKDTPFRWSIFNIVWRPQIGKPGYYEFVQMQPLHNGQGAFNCREKDHYVHWDKYEFEVIKIVKEYKDNGYYSIPSQFRNFMVWEMFLYMYDGWISKKMDSNFYRQVELSTSAELDYELRSNALKRAVNYLTDSEDSEKIIKKFNYQIMPMVNGHSKWLEDLVNV